MENYGLHVEIPRKNGILKNTPLTAIAFFVGSPQGWNISNWNTDIVKKFTTSLSECPNLSSNKIVVHGCYLINPASIKEEIKIKSEKRFLEEVKICDILGAGNYVFHPGSNKDTQKSLQYTVDLINLGLRETKNVNILVENMTKTNTLCQTWQEVEWIIKHVNNPRVGSCLDTAHCWGAGAKKGMFMDTLLDDYDRIVGIDTLKAIHLNDSKVEYGSNIDRHEDILKGKIPHSFWDSFIFDKRVKTIPAILETPSNCHSVITEIIKNKGVISQKEDNIGSSVVSIIPKKHINDFFSKTNTNTPKIIEKECPCSNSEESDSSDSSDSSDEESDSSDEKSDKSDEKSDNLEKNSNLEIKSGYEILETLFQNEWKDILQKEFKKPYFQKLKNTLIDEEKKGIKIYPPVNKIFQAFNQCTSQNIRVVIVGQDCYFSPGQAEGLSFSVPPGIKVPSSLQNIYKELATDIEGFVIPKHGHLGKWAEQGVFLLNSALTVEHGNAGSHLNLGWQEFTDSVLKYINENCKNVVFILWGGFAKNKGAYIDSKKHCVLTAVHPSGLSAHRGFFGCKHFSKCNIYLEQKGLNKINWQI